MGGGFEVAALLGFQALELFLECFDGCLLLGDLVAQLLQLAGVLHVGLGQLGVELVCSGDGLIALLLESLLIRDLSLQSIRQLIPLNLQIRHSELQLVRILTHTIVPFLGSALQ